MYRPSKQDNWVLIVIITMLVICVVLPWSAASATKNWLTTGWTPERRRFWFSSLIGLLVLAAIAILIIVKATTH